MSPEGKTPKTATEDDTKPGAAKPPALATIRPVTAIWTASC